MKSARQVVELMLQTNENGIVVVDETTVQNVLATVDALEAQLSHMRDDRRERFAAMAMQGFLSDATVRPAGLVAILSHEYADALIAELEK